MFAGVKLVAGPSPGLAHGLCCLCGIPCELGGVLLRDGGQSRGRVCRRCLEAGPRRAAARVRGHAARVRLLAERLRPCLPAWGWTGPLRVLHEYAAAQEDLAARVERLDGWDLEGP